VAEQVPQWRPSTPVIRQTAARRRRALRAAWLAALAIPFLFLLFASVAPLVDQAVGSFFNWSDIHPVSFAGWRYYRDVLADPIARAALVHTVIYVGTGGASRLCARPVPLPRPLCSLAWYWWR
jgi:ABC-type sugar transport system permease subunit